MKEAKIQFEKSQTQEEIEPSNQPERRPYPYHVDPDDETIIETTPKPKSKRIVEVISSDEEGLSDSENSQGGSELNDTDTPEKVEGERPIRPVVLPTDVTGINLEILSPQELKSLTDKLLSELNKRHSTSQDWSEQEELTVKLAQLDYHMVEGFNKMTGDGKLLKYAWQHDEPDHLGLPPGTPAPGTLSYILSHKRMFEQLQKTPRNGEYIAMLQDGQFLNAWKWIEQNVSMTLYIQRAGTIGEERVNWMSVNDHQIIVNRIADQLTLSGYGRRQDEVTPAGATGRAEMIYNATTDALRQMQLMMQKN